ncbi:MAG: hypothetical protein GXO24_07275 [Chlorobi bacterium]|nr:hypothetical protein [Chlorobiota bacterium]
MPGFALVRRLRLANANIQRLPARCGMAAPCCPPEFRQGLRAHRFAVLRAGILLLEDVMANEVKHD